MQIIEKAEIDQITAPCCECHKAMRHVGSESITPHGFQVRMTFECACGTVMIEDATLH